MQPVATTFFFYFLSAVTVTSGVMVITRRNPVHSALALILALLGQAGLYLMLYAPFVAGVQIILYAGGIMVLFLFVIMLVNIERSQHAEHRAASVSRLHVSLRDRIAAVVGCHHRGGGDGKKENLNWHTL